MWWKRGWILNSLNYQIEKNLRESIYNNESYKDNQWNLIERQILHWSESPKKYILLLLLAFILNMLCVYLWLPDIRANVTKWNQPWENLITWQSILLAAQLTIIGLIFPLVVGFVGLLLQNKTANRSLWLIYSQYSGFMFIGLSGLLLSGVIVFGQFIHPWMSYSTDVLFSIGVSIWFLFNISLAAWFLYATFRFVSNKHRNSLVSHYCTNEILITEIKARLSELIPSRAIELNLLPQNSESEEEPKVITFYYPDDNDSRYIINFKSKKYLKNIYFRMLAVAIRLWKAFSLLSPNIDKKQIQLPVSGKSRSSKEWIVALAFPELPLLIKKLILLSYTFSNAADISPTNIKPILNALIGEIDDALKDNNIRLFELAMDEMEDWHILLLDTAAFKDDDGEWDNWLLLSDGSFGNWSILAELSKEYHHLSRTAVQSLFNSKQYYVKFCYLYLHIYRYKNKKIARRVVTELIQSHYRLWMVLLDWRTTGYASQSESMVSALLESAIRTFVGSWEQWPNRLPLEIDDWDKSNQAMDQHIQHLACTARIVISAIRYDNYQAAEWAVDVLNHWYDTVFTGADPHQYRWRENVLVHSILGKDLSDPIWQWALNGENMDAQNKWNDAVRIGISNTWFDIRLATAAYILNKPVKELSSVSIRLCIALVSESRLKPGGGIERTHHRIRNGSDILDAYIRQRWFWRYGNNEYGNWLDNIIESFGRIEEPEYVSGRLYSGWGSKDIRHLKHAYMVMAACFSSNEWTLSGEMKDFLYSDAVELLHRETLIDDLKEWLNPTEEDIQKVKLYLVGSFSDDYIENLMESLSGVIENIRTQDEKVVINAQIDQERLLSFGKIASSTGFTISSGLVPLSLFSDIEYVENLKEDKYTHRIIDYDRSNVAEGVEPNRAINEEEWLDEIISKGVSQNILRKLIRALDYKEDSFEVNEELLERILEDASSLQALGYKPILFIGSWSLSSLLDSILWGYGEQINIPTLEIRKDDGFPDEYVCHLNGIEVYTMEFSDVNYSILTAEECFHVIRFRQISDGQYVHVYYSEKEDTPTKGDLILEYWMQIEFSSLPAFKYISLSTDD